MKLTGTLEKQVEFLSDELVSSKNQKCLLKGKVQELSKELEFVKTDPLMSSSVCLNNNMSRSLMVRSVSPRLANAHKFIGGGGTSTAKNILNKTSNLGKIVEKLGK